MPLTRSQRLSNDGIYRDDEHRAAANHDPNKMETKSRKALHDLSNKSKIDVQKKNANTNKAVVAKRTTRTYKASIAAKDAVKKVAAVLKKTSKKSSSSKENDKPSANANTKVADKNMNKRKKPHTGPRRRSLRLSGDSYDSRKSPRGSVFVGGDSPTTAFNRRQQDMLKDQPDDPNLLVQLRHRLVREGYDKGHSFTVGVASFDEEKSSDPLLSIPYMTDLFQNYYYEEGITRPKIYMEEQMDINSKMRNILVDWLVEVHMKFRLVPETLYLCVNMIDRYCEKVHNIRRSKLQLVGVTSLLLACKYEEIYPPEVRDCVYITDQAYDRDEVLEMEQNILNKLEWKISVPTAYPFLHRFLSLCKASRLESTAANYYLERVLQEHDMLQYRPSMLSAAAVLIAVNSFDVRRKERGYGYSMKHDPPGYPQILKEYTGFSAEHLSTCMEWMCKKIDEEPVTMSNRQLIAVKRKYDQEKYDNISGLPTPKPPTLS